MKNSSGRVLLAAVAFAFASQFAYGDASKAAKGEIIKSNQEKVNAGKMIQGGNKPAGTANAKSVGERTKVTAPVRSTAPEMAKPRGGTAGAAAGVAGSMGAGKIDAHGSDPTKVPSMDGKKSEHEPESVKQLVEQRRSRGQAEVQPKEFDQKRLDRGEELSKQDSTKALSEGGADTVFGRFNNPDNFGPNKSRFQDTMKLFDDVLAKADKADKEALRTVVGETLTRISKLPEDAQAAELQKLGEFAKKIAEGMKGKSADKAAELRKFAQAALLFYGVQPKPGDAKSLDIKPSLGLDKAMAKLEAYVKDPAAFSGFANYLDNFAKAYTEHLNGQLAKNPNLNRGDLDFKAAWEAGVKGMQDWAHLRLSQNGMKRKDADKTQESICRCTGACDIK